MDKTSLNVQAAAAGPPDAKDHATRAEACLLCDAELPPATDHYEEKAEDVSGALVDRGEVAPPPLPRSNSSRASSFRRGQTSSQPQSLQPNQASGSGSGRQQSLLGRPPSRHLRQQLQLHGHGEGAETKELGRPVRLQQQLQQQGPESGAPTSLIEIPRSYDVSGDASGPCDAAVGDHSHTDWMDAGSVWTSVQRYGEELQRRQRAAPPPPPQRRLSFVGAAAAAAVRWRCGSLKRFIQRVRTQVIVTARVAAKDPYTIIIPLLLLVCMLAFGLWGVLSVAGAIREGRRQAALNSATDFAHVLKSHIAATMAPASTVRTLIEIDPTWQSINKTFHERAPALVALGRDVGAVLTIVLVPQGIASAIVPTGIPAWEKVYGLDLLKEPAWRHDALKTVMLHDEGMVMTGPSRLRAGMMGIVTRYAVFVPGGPNDTFGFNGSAFNCSPCYEPPADPASGLGKRFWGFAQLNVDWEILIHNVTRMHDLCERDNLNYNMTYIDPVTSVNRSIANCTSGGGGLGPDALFVSIDTMQNHWVLAVTDSRGWTPDWLPLVVAVVVVVSLWVAVAMAIILINRREHMWLLQAMLPKKVIATLRRGEEYAEAFECVTVLFSDIVSYTTLASEMEPIKVVRLLNQMYSEYDALVDQFECYKVETIGDAFMAVCGTQGEDAVAAAVKVSRLAQAMIERTRVLVSADGQKIQIRIGLHSGPVVGAVVGFKMPHFCLCGDTVNTASRMESNSKPMRVHISDNTAALLAASNEGFRLERRGMIQIKGKGPMLTHWLLLDGGASTGGGDCGGGGGGGGGGLQLEKVASKEIGRGGVGATAAGLEEEEEAKEEAPINAAAEAATEEAAAAAAAAVAVPTVASGPGASSPIPWSSVLAAAAPPQQHTPFASGCGSGPTPSTAAAAAFGLTPSSSMGTAAHGGGNARRRFSEVGALSVGSFGTATPNGGSRLAHLLQGMGSGGHGGHGGGVSSSGVGVDGGGGGAVTMTCSGSGAAPRKPRTSVDLRLFQMSTRRSKGK